MVIHVYTVCWNAEDIMPYFLRHYSSFADKIIIYDNYSNDRTEAIIGKCDKAIIRKFDTNGKFDDAKNIEIKNNAYKESRGKADFVIVIDIDEFLYHPNINKLLSEYKNNGVTYPKVSGYDMVSYFFPNTSDQIYTQIKNSKCNSGYNKRCIFDPDIDTNYEWGAHNGKPVGNIKDSENADLKLLHYHYIGILHNLKKHKNFKERLPDVRITGNAGIQYRRGKIKILNRLVQLHADSRNIFTSKKCFSSYISYMILLLLSPFRYIKRSLEQLKA